MNDQGKSVRLNDELRLYVQKNSSYWWLSLRVGGKEKRVSTKVLIKDDPDGSQGAKSRAEAIAIEAKVMLKYGLEAESSIPSFNTIADKTIQHLKALTPQKPIYGSYQTVINNYLKPFFKHAPINKVNRHQVHRFYEWRQLQTKGGLSLTQKRVTNKALMHIFNFACDHGHIEQYLIPVLPSVSSKLPVRREFFTRDELGVLLSSFDGFISQSRSKKTTEIRAALKLYVHFLLGTGARPGAEVLDIKFGDLKFIRHSDSWLTTALIRTGKTSITKGAREVVLNNRAIEALESLIDLEPELRSFTLRDVARKFPTRTIFKVSYRESPPDYGRPFKSYLEYLGLGGRNFTLYSIRHTYITQRLLDDQIPRRAIAKQCGTSEEMIEKYYDHVISLDYAHDLMSGDGYKDLNAVDIFELAD